MNAVTHISADAYFTELMAEFEGAQACDTAKAALQLSRRGILKLSGAAGAGLVLAFALGANPARAAGTAAPKEFSPNGFLRVAPDGGILIYAKVPEIGQGTKTSFPMIIAEELDAAWSDVRVEQAPVNPAVFGRQSAGGSTSVFLNWDQLRRAGATARAMLVTAAAKQWGVKEAECTTADSAVVHAATGRRLKYGELAVRAAALPVPDPKGLTLKTRAQYRLLGTRVGGVDNLKLVTGQPLFGIDQRLPGMLYAVYEKCPAVGGRVVSANLEQIKKMPGVKDAFVIEGNGRVAEVMPGVAIIADSTWAAFRAKAALQVNWDESKASKDSWSKLAAQAGTIAAKAGEQVLVKSGDVNAAFKGAAKTVSAFYSYPFLPHACLEPMNSTAWFKGNEMEVWAPTQSPERGLSQVAKLVGLPEDKVTFHQTRAGGAFGRRGVNDPTCEAAAIAQRVPGVPVKLTWTREDDMRHDFYRAGGFHALSGALDAKGKLIAWRDHFITFSGDGKNPVTGGNMPEDEFPLPLIANAELTQTMLPLATPCGAWRNPRSNGVAFAVQSFIHELALAGGRDHIEFFLEILGEPRWLVPGNPSSLNTGRAAAVVKLAAEKSGWGRTLPPGRALGFGFHFSHMGHFAEVAEVSVDSAKHVTVHKVTAVGDIGPVVNMSGAENQVEGAVTDGLSTLLNLQVGIENGRVLEGNFTEYPILRMKDAPQVESYFIQSDFPPTGLGEPPLPPVMAAVANGVFSATGMRYRSMPLRSAVLAS